MYKKLSYQSIGVAFLMVLICLIFSASASAEYPTLHGDLGSYTGYYYYLDEDDEYLDYRVYVPPGTTKISLLSYVPNDSSMYAVIRFGGEPGNSPKPASFAEGCRLKDLREGKTCYARNQDGMIVLVSQGMRNYPITQDESGWLYVSLRGASKVYKTGYNLIIGDEQKYTNWYRAINWPEFDENYTGSPSGGGDDYYSGGDDPYGGDGNQSPTGDDDQTGSDGDSPYGGDEDNDDNYTPPINGKNPNSSIGSSFECLLKKGTWDNKTSTCYIGGTAPPSNDDNSDDGSSDSGNPADDGSSTDNDGDGAFGGGDRKDKDSGSGDNPPNTTSPFEIPCGKMKQKEINASDVEGRNTFFPIPVIMTDGTSQDLDYFAMVTVNDLMFMAVKDVIFSDVSFIEYKEGDRLQNYKSGPLAMSNLWKCNVFADYLSSLDIKVSDFAKNNVHFLAGYAPAGEVQNGNFQNFHYVDLWFSPDLR